MAQLKKYKPYRFYAFVQLRFLGSNKEDIQVGRFKSRRLMKKLGLKARYPKRFKVTTDSDHNALQMAFWRRKPEPGLLHHSDRGSQYASQEYREHLEVMNMQQSMSRKGSCWDNAPTERFFRSLKHEQLNYETFRTKEAAKLSIIDYFAFYNGKRMHSKLGYQTPLEIEREFYK